MLGDILSGSTLLDWILNVIWLIGIPAMLFYILMWEIDR